MAFSRNGTSMLPTIKCSNCGLQIDIAQMGDHNCGHQGILGAPYELNDVAHRTSIAPVPSHQPFARFATAYSSMNGNQAAPVPLRPRPVPARIDAAAASMLRTAENTNTR